MRVVQENERPVGELQTPRVGRLSFIEVDGVPTADLPLTIEGTSTPIHLRGANALAGDALLNRKITSTQTLALILGVPPEEVEKRVQSVAGVARRAGIAISRDPDHGDVYVVRFNTQKGKPGIGVVHEWRSADGSPVSPGRLFQVGRMPNSGTRRINGPHGARVRR